MKGFHQFLLLFCICHFAESAPLQAQAAKEERTIIFDAVGIGANHTMLGKHEGLGYDWGFNVGFYHSGRKGKRLDVLFGMEYNLNRLLLDYRNDGRWGHSRDLQFNIHTVSVPIFLRWHLDHKQRFFVEAGAYMDLNVYATERGKRHSISVEDGSLSSSISSSKTRTTIRRFNYGPYAGVGYRLHIAGRPLLLKADARYGNSSIYEDVHTEMYMSYGRIVAVMEF